MLTLAFDRSARRVDSNGHLHVTACRISKAAVNTYLGREVVDWQKLGLQPDREYKLLRTPALLRAIASSFENSQLLMDHVVVSADKPAQDMIVGAVSNVKYADPYLVADLAVWTREGRDAIESGERKELSCAYRYSVDMTPGVFGGVRFDGRMVPPGGGNHVALVVAGRAGPDVVVADSALRKPFNAADVYVPHASDLFSIGHIRRT